MRGPLVTILGLAGVFAFGTSVDALQKRAVRLHPDDADDWSTASTCLVSYYNICTGWVWVFGFDDPAVPDDESQVGVHVIGDSDSWTLVSSRIRYWSGSPGGWGFTGTIATYAADENGCPVGAPIESQPFIPPYVPGGNAVYTQSWSGAHPLPQSFVIAATFLGDNSKCCINPLGLGTDFGTIGPTGPDACGTCFPTGRESHSYLWRNSAGTFCPGITFLEQDCEVELLWDLTLSCTVSVETSTWGAIKTLYR